MDAPTDKVDRDATTPFLLKLFYRTGAFHRPDEFSSPAGLPPHLTVYTWPSATLSELTHQLAAADPDILPSPAIGTRLAFRHLFHDTRTNTGAPARIASKELGSVVIGDGGPGIADEEEEAAGSAAESSRMLAEVRLVVGDYLSVAILPPSSVDGSVQPAAAAAARSGRGPPVRREGDGAPRDYGRSHGTRLGGLYARDGVGAAPPVGEWRRGERLPDVPSARGRPRIRW